MSTPFYVRTKDGRRVTAALALHRATTDTKSVKIPIKCVEPAREWCSPCIDILCVKSLSRLICGSVDIFRQHGLTQKDLQRFNDTLCGDVIYPWDESYQTVRLNYNLIYNVFPLAIVRAKCVKDVKRSIRWVQKHNLPMTVRSGGHCFEPFSLITNGVIIDQENRTKIKIHRNKVRVQPGVRLGPLVKRLAQCNLTLPVGTCSNNGVAGFTLGGGFGFASRAFGITIDRLVNVKIVLANRKCINANKDENSDLFFALRGAGGGNYGIIVEFVFNAVTLPKCNVYFEIRYPLGFKLFPLIDRWQRWSDTLPDFITSAFDIRSPNVSEYQITGLALSISKRKLRKIIKPLIEDSEHVEIEKVSLVESARLFAADNDRRLPFFKGSSAFALEFMSEDAANNIEEAMANLPNDIAITTRIECMSTGGKISDVPPDETAFFYRDAHYWLLVQSDYNDDSEENRRIAAVEEVINVIRAEQFSDGAYVNIPDILLNNFLEMYYGDNLPRLRVIKTKYDPKNFFKFAQSITGV